MKTMLAALALITMAAIAARGQSRPAGQDVQAPRAGQAKSKAVDCYPLKVGTKWHYQVDPGNGYKVQITSQIAGVEQVDGKALARLEFSSDGQKLSTTEHLQSNEEGVFRVRMNGDGITPPLCLIKYPLKPGQTWESEISIANGPRAKVVGSEGEPEEIQVPAGKFRAIPCTIVVTEGETRTTSVYWFAEDVGIVKQRSELGSETVTTELTKFEAAR